MMAYLVVFLGAGIGGMLRHAANRAGMALLGSAFPWSTLVVNVTGSLIMGLLAGWLALRGEGAGQALRLFLTTGILGGYTTFSSFSLDAALFYERGALGLMALYILASVVVSIAALFAGLFIVRQLGQG